MVVFNSETMRSTYLEGRPSLQGRAMFVIAPDATVPSAAFVSVPVPNPATIAPLLQQHMIVRTQADVDAIARCNPVTAPKGCRDRDIENAKGLGRP